MKKYFYLGLCFLVLCFLASILSGCIMRKIGDPPVAYAVFNFKDADGFLSKEDFEKLYIITEDLKNGGKKVWTPSHYPKGNAIQIDGTQCKVTFQMPYTILSFKSFEEMINSFQVKIISDKYKTKEIKPLSALNHTKDTDDYIYYFDDIILEKR